MARGSEPTTGTGHTGDTARPFVPVHARSLRTLAEAARGCRGCDLWQRGTQTVFGDGSAHARVVLVGEQPGNEEDLAGKPFIGPAGRFLDRCLVEAGIERAGVYVTNAVKHFKWVPRGKRRIHEKPSPREVTACSPWLEAELHLIDPRVLVLLGATAAQALLGASFRVTRMRGRLLYDTGLAEIVMATVHPSSVLRARDEARAIETARFVDDLRAIAAVIPDP